MSYFRRRGSFTYFRIRRASYSRCRRSSYFKRRSSQSRIRSSSYSSIGRIKEDLLTPEEDVHPPEEDVGLLEEEDVMLSFFQKKKLRRQNPGPGTRSPSEMTSSYLRGMEAAYLNLHLNMSNGNESILLI